MKKIALIAVTLMFAAASADAAVWRVRQNRHWGAVNGNPAAGGYVNMPDYIEPAAAAANAAFGGTTANDTWNSYDVDTRYGSIGGYNFIQNVRVGGLNPDDNVAQETLYSGDLGSTVKIRSLANNSQHSPWYSLPTTGSGFDQLVGGEHSAGTNAGGSYSVEISGLTAGETFLFYSYAHRVASGHGAYLINLDGAAWTTVTQNVYSEGDAASGVLLSKTVPSTGIVVVNYSQAGMTGPAFQFATVPEPATLSLLVLGGIATLIRRRNRRA